MQLDSVNSAVREPDATNPLEFSPSTATELRFQSPPLSHREVNGDDLDVSWFADQLKAGFHYSEDMSMPAA